MLAALLGKKIGMTQVYDEAGALHPVTIVQAGPCRVLQIKKEDGDGYNAVQLGFDEVRPHRAAKPQIGHAAKANAAPCKWVREVRLDAAADDVELGQSITVAAFDGVRSVDVIGTSKGKGFAGVMKRYNFSGLGASHGTKRKHRSPGSIGGHGSNLGWAGDIKKGKRMAGHMGAARCTTRKLKLVAVDSQNDLLLIKGAVPGANGSYVFIRQSRTAAAAAK